MADFRHVHYRPAQRAPWCDEARAMWAAGRVAQVHVTSNVSAVRCVDCLFAIATEALSLHRMMTGETL